MAQKNADIWISKEGENYDIDVLLESHNDIDVVMGGTSLFNANVDIELALKNYLEHPNDLTTLYVGNSVIAAVAYTHTQGIGATQWTINHNLGRAHVVIQCFDNNKKQVFAEIQHINSNQSVARFGFSMSGTAEVR